MKKALVVLIPLMITVAKADEVKVEVIKPLKLVRIQNATVPVFQICIKERKSDGIPGALANRSRAGKNRR